jgi:nicotinate-nucleotide--dimethylbenzimidazole phosphoribosyltransferase
VEPGATIDGGVARIRPPDEPARSEARALQARLTKPRGSLGRLEELHIWAAGVLGSASPQIEKRAIVVAAADHGVAAARAVSAYPPAVTWQMVRNMLSGGAAINALARQAGAELCVVDAGVARETADERLAVVKTRAGSADMTREQAMPRDECEMLVARGIACAERLYDGGVRAIALGDMGIGNTTAAAAITSVMAGAPPAATTGRGTGVDDETYARKVAAVTEALALHRPDPADALDVLSTVGGCEFAFLAGVALGGAGSGAAVVLDGYPTAAAALIACGLAPACREYLLASHLSAEPGHALALERLGLRPLLDLDLRLGEGTGAALALMLLDASLRLPREMATFGSAGVSRATAERPPEA